MDATPDKPERVANELRPVKFELDFVSYPEGSVLISMGNTRVLCNATVQNSLPRWLRYSSKRHGWVTAEYAMLPRSTHSRSNRETNGLKGRSHEIKRLIARSLRGAVDLDALGERQIIIDCDVLQADGGTRTASITGGYVAMALAIARMVEDGTLAHNPITGAVAAVSVGIVDGAPVLDLDYAMDLRAGVDMNVVMTDDGRFVEVQGTAEGEPYTHDELQAMLALADDGIRQLLEKQAAALTAAGY